MVKFYVTLWSLASQLRDRSRDDEGATAVEYGLMVALIAVAIVAAVGALGIKLSGLFDLVTSKLP